MNSISQTVTKTRYGKKIFAILSAVFFLVAAFYVFVDSIDSIIDYVDMDSGKHIAYSVFKCLFMLTEFVLIAIVCFTRKKSNFTLFAAALPFLVEILLFTMKGFIFDGAQMLKSGVVLIFSFMALIALAVVCIVPAAKEKCTWSKYLGAVPGAIYFIYILARVTSTISGMQIMINFFVYLPAFIFFGLWLASTEVESIEVPVRPVYTPTVQYAQYQQPMYQAQNQQYAAQYQQPAYQPVQPQAPVEATPVAKEAAEPIQQ